MISGSPVIFESTRDILLVAILVSGCKDGHGRDVIMRVSLPPDDSCAPRAEHVLHIDSTWPWAQTITTAHPRLRALPVP